MKVFYEGVLDRQIEKSFVDKEGKTVAWNELHFFTEDEEGMGSVVIVNTQQDFSLFIGKPCVLGLEIDAEGKRKPRVISLEDK